MKRQRLDWAAAVRVLVPLGLALAVLPAALAAPRVGGGGAGTRPLAAAAAAGEKTQAAGADLTAGGFENARRAYRFAFPRDDAAHFGYRTEWWYYTGHVRAADGRPFGYELTFFRVGLRPGDPPPPAGKSAWRGNQIYFAHFALSDEAGKRFVHFERFAREALGAGSASERRLDVHVNDWTLAGTAPFRMHARAGGDAITFEQFSEKPPAVHGHDGVSVKAACVSCASHYYSLTRLRTSGTLTYGGRRLAVTGISWMDHEFGSAQLQASQAGWDWFSIQLADRRELMLYRLRQTDGSVTPESSGSIIDARGRVTHLRLGDFTTEATGSWKSPHTGATYPSGWRVRVPRANIDLVLQPTLVDQELADTSGLSYWEGAVDALDTATQRPLGAGYVELTGYAGSVGL